MIGLNSRSQTACRMSGASPGQQPIWFHGCISREEAARRLKTATTTIKNPFLVRQRDNGEYVLSLWMAGCQIVHSKVERLPNGLLQLYGAPHSFPDIESVIDDYSSIMKAKGGITPVAAQYPVPFPDSSGNQQVPALPPRISQGALPFDVSKSHTTPSSVRSVLELVQLKSPDVMSSQTGLGAPGRSRSFDASVLTAASRTPQKSPPALPKRVKYRAMSVANTMATRGQQPLPVIPPYRGPLHAYTEIDRPGSRANDSDSEEYDYVDGRLSLPVSPSPRQPQLPANTDDFDDLSPNVMYGRTMPITPKRLPSDVSSLDQDASYEPDDVTDLDRNPLYGRNIDWRGRGTLQPDDYEEMSQAGPAAEEDYEFMSSAGVPARH